MALTIDSNSQWGHIDGVGAGEGLNLG